jgi:hypothetical protein
MSASLTDGPDGANPQADEPRALAGQLEYPQPPAAPADPEEPADPADRAGGRHERAALDSLARRALFAAAVTGTAIILFFCYWRLSRTFPLDSDESGNALQAWDMLHGNLLLRGWTLSDVSFYTTELPEYMLVELIHGLNSETVHISSALTYTLVVVLVALVAKGRTTGKRAALRMLVAAGILISPQLGLGVWTLLAQPDHTGTNVPVLLAWLIVDRGGRRWWVPPATAVLLAVAYVADEAALISGVLPLLVVAGWRLYQRVYQRRPDDTEFLPALARAGYELSMVGAALVALVAGLVVPKIIRHIGGYTVLPVQSTIGQSGNMVAHIWAAISGGLFLFGANLFGLKLSLSAGLVALHLVGVALAVWAVCAGVRRFAGDDVVSALLAVGAVLAVGAYLLYPTNAGPREMVAVLPFSAVLVGRLLVDRLAAARLVPVIAIALILYVVTLGVNVTTGPEAKDFRPLASWLSDHGFRYGLSNYGYSNSLTVATGNRVQIRPVQARAGQDKADPLQLYPRMWEADKSWYDPALHYANFVIIGPLGTGMTQRQALHNFGPPARSYSIHGVSVLVWNYNLLTRTDWGHPWPVFDPSG